MSKAILRKYIQKQSGITSQEAGIVFDIVLDGITETLLNNGKIKIPNFGRFKIKTVRARMGRNPKTGESVRLPSRKVIRFRAAQKLKDRLLLKKSGSKF